MIGRRAPSAGRLAAAFYVAFFTLMASGRLATSDAGAQLQAAMRVVTAGEIGADSLPATGASGWQRAPNGRFYEPHDIGNIVLMLPAAWIGHATSHVSADQDVAALPAVSRLAVSLTYALVNALTCVFLFELFALAGSAREAFALSLTFAAATLFLPYAKTAFDVVGACSGVAAFTYASARVVSGERTPKDAAAAGAAFALACAFRYSLAPFLGVSAVVIGYALRRDIGARHVVCFATAAAFGLAPSFLYNQVRTGEFWRPATATAAYLATNNALGGNIVRGAIGLLAAPDRGLFVFSPVFLLLFALPFVWARVARADRVLVVALGSAAALYRVALARLTDWGGAFGWGPRYLVPVLPMLFVGVAASIKALWTRQRGVVIAVVALSALLNVAPTIVSWSNAVVTYPGALDQGAPLPLQHPAVWRALGGAVAGVRRGNPARVAAIPSAARASRTSRRLAAHGTLTIRRACWPCDRRDPGDGCHPRACQNAPTRWPQRFWALCVRRLADFVFR